MANRQYGRGRSPSGNRNSAGGRSGRRTAQAVSVSRSQADGRGAGAVWTASTPGTPGYLEPEVRRWPHPVEDAESTPAPEPTLHYIRCALSYQNQLLSDIKSLLERLTAEPPAEADGSKL